jgi:peptidoglycan/xylan/chitin deacetylase (PgdA/CDA1 family)
MVDAAILLLLVVLAALAAAFAWTWFDEARRPRVICLMYHRFATPAAYAGLTGAERLFRVTIDRFDEQLRYLVARGYHCVSADAVVDFVTRRAALPQPAVQITIDDGSASVLEHAQPILRRHGCRATLFLTTDAAAAVFAESGERRLSEAELRGLDPAAIELAAHGVSHYPLVDLDDAALARELERCRADVERISGRATQHLAIPGGWYDRRVLQAAAAAGFRGVWLSDAGANRPGRDPLRIRRLNVDGFAELAEFEALFAPLAVAQRRSFSALKRLPARLLGPGRWLPLRRRIRGAIRAEALSFRALRRVALALTLALALLAAWWFLIR